MRPSIILHQTTKSIIVSDSGRELTFGVNSPTNLGELTFKKYRNGSYIDHSGVAVAVEQGGIN
jgi:hypothetical protein